MCVHFTCIGLLTGGWFAATTSAETVRYRYDATRRLTRATAFQRGVAWDYRFDLADSRRA